MHSKKIAHRDLKLENLLLQGDPAFICACTVKVCDLGLAGILPDEMPQPASPITPTSVLDGDVFARSPPGSPRLDPPPQFHPPRFYTPCGSPMYAPPEIVPPCSGYGLKVDIWSLGVVSVALLVGAFPFDSARTEDVLQLVRHGFPRDFFNNPFYPNVSPQARSFCHGLLTSSPEARPSAAAALQHPWMRVRLDEYGRPPRVQRTRIRTPPLRSLVPSLSPDDFGDLAPTHSCPTLPPPKPAPAQAAPPLPARPLAAAPAASSEAAPPPPPPVRRRRAWLFAFCCGDGKVMHSTSGSFM